MVKRAELLLKSDREAAAEAEYTTQGEAMQLGDADSEDAWDDWIQSLKNAENTGTVRAYKLPTDEDGNPRLGKGTRQISLGSWAHQLYSPSELEAKIVREFLKPGEIAHVKFTGTSNGTRGTVFSRIVTLQRPEAMAADKENVGTLFKVVQEGQAMQLQTLREIFQPPAAPVQSAGMSPLLVKSLELSIPILGSIITAIIARPKPQSDIGQLISAMADLKSLVPGSESPRDDDSTTVAIVKAVAPALPQLLQYLNSQPKPPAATGQRQLASPGVAAVIDPTKPTVVQASVRQPPPPFTTPPPTPGPPDRTTGDTAMLAQLKPQLEMLAEIAARGEPPEEVAQLLLQTLPEEFDDALSRLVETPEAFKSLGLISPAIRQHAEWFERLRLALAQEFAPEMPAAPRTAQGPLPGDLPSG